METYPDYCILRKGFNVTRDEGLDLMRAEGGEPWLYYTYDKAEVQFTFLHLMELSDERDLRDFYNDNRGKYVLFNCPRTGDQFEMLMIAPPEPMTVVGRNLTEVRMQLLGRAL